MVGILDVVDDEKAARFQMRIEKIIFEVWKRKAVRPVDQHEVVSEMILIDGQRRLRRPENDLDPIQPRRRAIHEIGDAGILPARAVVQAEHPVLLSYARKENRRFAASRLRQSIGAPGSNPSMRNSVRSGSEPAQCA